MATSGLSLPTDWVKRIESKLECPVCFKTILDPPVYICVNIHKLCEVCHDELKQRNQKCPQCRGDFTGKRNLGLEDILELLPKTKCQFEGCTFAKADVEKVAKHEGGCKHRLVKCYVCNKAVPVLGLADHQYTVHKTLKIREIGLGCAEAYSICDYGRNLSCPLPVTHGEEGLTMFYNILNLGDRQLRWISHNQSKEDTEKYKYSISFLCGKTRDAGKAAKRIVTFSGYCVPTDVSLDTIKKETSVLIFPGEFHKKYVDKDKQIHFEIRVDKARDGDNMQG